MNDLNTLLDSKIGNITFGRFFNDLDLDRIKDVSIVNDTLESQYGSKLTGSYTLFVKTDRKTEFDKVVLSKLSKHNRKYDIRLGDTRLNKGVWEYSFKFMPKIKLKYPSKRTPEFSVETIRDIVGLPKKDNYTYISSKPCNNGWQYIYHMSVYPDDISLFNLKDKLNAILRDYYSQVFFDTEDNLRVVITKKKSYFRDNIAKINRYHFSAILGDNLDTWSKVSICPVIAGYEIYLDQCYNGTREGIVNRLSNALNKFYEVNVESKSTHEFPNQFCIKLLDRNFVHRVTQYTEKETIGSGKTEDYTTSCLRLSNKLLRCMVHTPDILDHIEEILDIEKWKLLKLVDEYIIDVGSFHKIEKFLK